MDSVKFKATVLLKSTDYFLCLPEGDTFTLSATCSDGNPIRFTGMTRKQLYTLLSTLQRATLLADQEKLKRVLAPDTQPLQDREPPHSDR